MNSTEGGHKSAGKIAWHVALRSLIGIFLSKTARTEEESL